MSHIVNSAQEPQDIVVTANKERLPQLKISLHTNNGRDKPKFAWRPRH